MWCNETYELIGGVLYNTPETDDNVESKLFIRAKEVADALLEFDVKKNELIITNINEETRNYMNSPVVDFLYGLLIKPDDPVITAVCSGNVDALKYLLKCNIACPSNAIYYAHQRGRYKVVKYLESFGIGDVLHKQPDDGINSKYRLIGGIMAYTPDADVEGISSNLFHTAHGISKALVDCTTIDEVESIIKGVLNEMCCYISSRLIDFLSTTAKSMWLIDAVKQNRLKVVKYLSMKKGFEELKINDAVRDVLDYVAEYMT